MNRNLRSLRQLAATCLGIAFSQLMFITTPAFSAPAHALGAFTLSAPSLTLAAATAGRIKADAKEFEGKTQDRGQNPEYRRRRQGEGRNGLSQAKRSGLESNLKTTGRAASIFKLVCHIFKSATTANLPPCLKQLRFF